MDRSTDSTSSGLIPVYRQEAVVQPVATVIQAVSGVALLYALVKFVQMKRTSFGITAVGSFAGVVGATAWKTAIVQQKTSDVFTEQQQVQEVNPVEGLTFEQADAQGLYSEFVVHEIASDRPVRTYLIGREKTEAIVAAARSKIAQLPRREYEQRFGVGLDEQVVRPFLAQASEEQLDTLDWGTSTWGVERKRVFAREAAERRQEAETAFRHRVQEITEAIYQQAELYATRPEWVDQLTPELKTEYSRLLLGWLRRDPTRGCDQLKERLLALGLDEVEIETFIDENVPQAAILFGRDLPNREVAFDVSSIFRPLGVQPPEIRTLGEVRQLLLGLEGSIEGHLDQLQPAALFAVPHHLETVERYVNELKVLKRIPNLDMAAVGRVYASLMAQAAKKEWGLIREIHEPAGAEEVHVPGCDLDPQLASRYITGIDSSRTVPRITVTSVADWYQSAKLGGVSRNFIPRSYRARAIFFGEMRPHWNNSFFTRLLCENDLRAAVAFLNECPPADPDLAALGLEIFELEARLISSVRNGQLSEEAKRASQALNMFVTGIDHSESSTLGERFAAVKATVEQAVPQPFTREIRLPDNWNYDRVFSKWFTPTEHNRHSLLWKMTRILASLSHPSYDL